MRLTHRPARVDELAGFFNRFGDSFAYPTGIRERVPAVWADWLRQGLLMTAVIEDHAELGAAEAVGFGASIFVSGEFARDACRSAQPYQRAELIRRWLAGEPAVLNLDQIRNDNAADGLTVFFANDALSNRALSEEDAYLVDVKWSESLYELRSCRLREILWEVNSPLARRWALGCGLAVRRDWPEQRAAQAAPEDLHPCLVGINQAEAAAQPGAHASFMFQHVSPRFGLTARQQELLLLALQGETDDSLAASLKLSVPAVKKRWVAIYERLSTVAPGWLENTATGGGDTRGSEKRRTLLNYLRQHPEELHPANASRD